MGFPREAHQADCARLHPPQLHLQLNPLTVDPFSHVLSGALLARASAHRRTALPLRLRVAAGCGAALFPDIDVALRLVDTLTYLNLHQGITHSLVMLPVWTFLLSALFAVFTNRRTADFFAPVALGLSIHVAGDLITAYGLQLFTPLSQQHFSLSWAFVIDPVITLILATGALLSWLRPDQRSAAIGALVLVACYLGFLSQQHREALSIAQVRAATHDLSQASAWPQPLSPYHWKLVVSDESHHQQAHVNLREHAPLPWPGLLGGVARAYGEKEWTELPRLTDEFSRQAWLRPEFSSFRQFAKLPRIYAITHDGGQRCAWFVDMRFEVPTLGPSFRFGSCQSLTHPQQWERIRARGRFWMD